MSGHHWYRTIIQYLTVHVVSCILYVPILGIYVLLGTTLVRMIWYHTPYLTTSTGWSSFVSLRIQSQSYGSMVAVIWYVSALAAFDLHFSSRYKTCNSIMEQHLILTRF